MLQQSEALRRSAASALPSATAWPAAGHSTAAAAVAAAALPAPGEALLEQPDVVALYIRLLCQYEPRQVLPFLQSRHNYDVRMCLRCARWGRCVCARAVQCLGHRCDGTVLHGATVCRCGGGALYAFCKHDALAEVLAALAHCLTDSLTHWLSGSLLPALPCPPARHCKDHGVSDAEAFLHERLGDMEAALRLYLADIRASWQALQGALEAGRLQVLAGQQGGAGQGRGSDTELGQGGGALGGWLQCRSCL